MLQWTVIKEFWHTRPSGKRERFVRIRCGCGTERSMSISIWNTRRSLKCKRCNLDADKRRGYVESDIPGSIVGNGDSLASVTAVPTYKERRPKSFGTTRC